LFGGERELVLKVQQVLSLYGYIDPPADGRFGPVSIWGLREFCALNDLSLSDGFTRDIARALINPQRVLPEIKRTGTWFDRVVAYMKNKGYWMCRHPRCANVIYLEGVNANGTLNDDRPNVFNDLRVVCFIDPSGMPNLRSWEGTTEPGTYWTMNPMSPGGAARIAFDQYKSWIVGTHRAGTSGAHEALVQVQPVSVHRDLNKDFKRTNDRIDTGLFGINQHWGYDAPKDDLGQTSAGCLVGRTKAGHVDFMTLLKADPRFNENPGYKFMSTVLPGDQVLG
jgi:hypothetical protein